MSMFALAISHLTASNLPWFMDLTFQVPMQSWSLQHRTSITSHIHNWALFSLWLHLFILSGVISPSFPVAYWAPTDLGSLSFSVIYFCLLILLTADGDFSHEIKRQFLLERKALTKLHSILKSRDITFLTMVQLSKLICLQFSKSGFNSCVWKIPWRRK